MLSTNKFNKLAMAWIIFMLGYGVTKAQHPPLFSQYMFNTLPINPAYTGSRDALSISALARLQWVGFTGAPSTQTLNFHTPLKDRKNNIGLIVFNDKLGVTYNTGIFGTYAFRFEVSQKARLAFGLQGGISMYQDRWSQLSLTDVNDPNFAADSPVFLIPRAGFGIYLDHPRYYIGFSTPQLFRYENPALSMYNTNSLLYDHYFLSGGYLFKFNPDIKFRPTALVRYIKNSPVQYDINATMIFRDKVWVGASYRSEAAIVGMVELQLNKQFRIGYSFDHAITSLSKYNSGSHELFIRYEFGYGVRAMSPRYF